MKKLTEEIDYTDYNCFMVVIIAHGDKDRQDHFLDTEDNSYSVNQFVKHVCGVESLKEKPKIFLVDICRGGWYLAIHVLYLG